MITQRKYKSANEILGKDDSEYIIYKRVDLLTNYFIKSANHKMFYLADLNKNDDLFELRKQTGEFLVEEYDIEKIISEFQRENGEKPILNLALANYYISLYRNFGDNLGVPIETINDLVTKNYDIAEKNGVVDHYLYYEKATNFLAKKDLKSAEECYKKSLEINPKYSYAWNYLGLVQSQLSNNTEAIKSLKNALLNEINPKSKAAEYQLLADIYFENKQYDLAEKTLQDAKKDLPQYLGLQMQLGYMYSVRGYEDKAKKELLDVCKKDEDLFTSIASDLYKQKKYIFIQELCDEYILFVNNDENIGRAIYFSALMDYMLSNPQAALEKCKTVREYYTKANILNKYEEDISDFEQECKDFK